MQKKNTKQFKMTFNFHTHTSRCGHAFGEDEQYVRAAIEKGIKVLGFSDHVFFPNAPQDGIRMNECDYEDYKNSILALKEKYKDIIEIHFGFEVEYISKFRPHYDWLIDNPDIEYMILGQHCYWDTDYEYYMAPDKDDSIFVRYVDDLLEGLKLGCFMYIAHPDIVLNIHRTKDDFTVNQMKRIIDASLKYDIPLEVNLGGARTERRRKEKAGDPTLKDLFYPYDWFWEMAGKAGVKVVVGIDAHAPTEITDSAVERAIELINKYNLKLVDKLELKKKYY